jgi:isopentenyl diphosphate isomerase/L-lactate dehydrogenase-like FMN-dependent dehydrogenase
MVAATPRPSDRRAFLRFLAASPLLCAALPRGWTTVFARQADLIASAKDALDVFDLEAVARKNLTPAHLGYLETGTDDDATIRANREGFTHYQLRMRRLVDISRVDTSVRLFGTTWETPIFLCPIGSQKTFHPEGEVAVARAAKARNHLFMLATPGSASVEEVNAARGEPVWFQLYQRNDWSQTQQLIKRVEAAGCPALVFTIDLLGGSNRLTVERARRRDTSDCGGCHKGTPGPDPGRRPMTAGLKPDAPVLGPPTWDYVKRLKDATPMKLLLKGIVTREDAELAMQHGVDGVYVSNHGGRAENSLRSTIECLPEVVAGVAGRAPVIVDSGFRRGTDIFKALALGATAVGIGRPYIWGLAAFGQDGVEATLNILRRELQMVMRQAGTTAVSRITRASVVERPWGQV